MKFTPSFGRIPEYDSENERFKISHLPGVREAPTSTIWLCQKVLHQGMAPRCTSFSFTTELLAKPVAIPLRAERFAARLHRTCGTSNGASVLAVVKELARQGYYLSYHWGGTLNDLLLGLVIGPVVLGIDWYESMNQPSQDGFLRQPSGKFLGRHCLLGMGYNIKSALVPAQNTWGKSWGRNGQCLITFELLHNLLARPHAEMCLPLGRRNPSKNASSI